MLDHLDGPDRGCRAGDGGDLNLAIRVEAGASVGGQVGEALIPAAHLPET